MRKLIILIAGLFCVLTVFSQPLKKVEDNRTMLSKCWAITALGKSESISYPAPVHAAFIKLTTQADKDDD